ncbi:heme exporter protein CcmD [Undibacterium amnicola]|uniref:Heme exporter protein D n=1 Tax=Undibacterium amnicola TaxID=1834038 RepID=A0ABR6XT99_9BURK|nr:heme exporter protein CcmD [Undibacterium amnicola]MBC3832715.1 heme exporter protein CcmD [Undibacterium amnicola]
MSWLSYQDFFAMGGYGLYVWGSYSVFFSFIIWEVLYVFSRNRAAIKLHCAQQKLSPQRALEQDQAFERVVAATAEKSRTVLTHYDVLSQNQASQLR